MAKADTSEDLRQKIVSASGGSYEYEKLRDALAAMSPTISRADHHGDKDSGQPRLWKGRRFDRRVNMVADFGDDDSENEALAIEAEVQDEMAMAEAMGQEATVLMTQAAKRRSMVERARGFQKAESSEERAKRISNMKQRMPCNACRAHGKTVFGHWRSDKECPYFEETKKKKEKSVFITESGDPAEDHAAFVVGQASSEEEDDQDDDAFLVRGTGLGQSCLRKESINLGLSDTCCAKTVAGREWVRIHVEKFKEHGLPFKYLPEREPFRFGGGPKVFSAMALVFPLCIPGCRVPVMLRTSIVDQEVPLLISRGALQAMGMVTNLVDSSMRFEKLGCITGLVTTSTGHVGFHIMSNDAQVWKKGVDWTMAETKKETEIFFADELDGIVRLRTGADSDRNPSCDDFPEPRRYMRDCRNVLEQSHLDQLEQDSESSCPSDRHGAVGSGQGCAKEEAGVHRPDPRIPEDQLGSQRPANNVSGSDQGNLSDFEAQERSRTFAGGLETGHCGDASKLLHREGCHLLSPRQERALEGVDQEPFHFGDRDVRSGRHGRGGPHWEDCGKDGGGDEQFGRSPSVGTVLPNLRRRDVGEDKPRNGRSVLGMSPLPQLQKDISIPNRRETHSRRDGSLGEAARSREDPPEGRREGIPNIGEEGWLWQVSRSIRGRFADFLGSGERAHGDLQRQPCRPEVQCKPHRGRDEGLDRKTQDQVGCEEPGVKTPDVWQPSPLDRDEIEAKISQRKVRVKNMKRGVAKRLMGNAYSILLTLSAVATGMCGASVQGLLPSTVFGSAQPDVIEIGSGDGCICTTFSKWGWFCCEVGRHVPGELLDVRYQRFLMEKLEQEQPRLVVFECPRIPSSGDVKGSSSMQRQQQRRNRTKHMQLWSFLESVCDLQIKSGRDVLGKCMAAEVATAEGALARIVSHPDMHCTVVESCNHEASEVTTWLASCVEIHDEIQQWLCKGGRRVGHVDRSLCQHIHKGFIRMLKRKEPGRVLSLLRAVQKRIRSDKESRIPLRWSERKIQRTLQHWVGAVETANQPQDVTMDEEELIRDDEDGRLGEDGVMFNVPSGRLLSKPLRQALRKIHLNLGHPSVSDLQRFLS